MLISVRDRSGRDDTMINWLVFGNFLQAWASVGVPLFCVVLLVWACESSFRSQRPGQ